MLCLKTCLRDVPVDVPVDVPKEVMEWASAKHVYPLNIYMYV